MEKPVGFLFPGQGAQYVGMGRDLFDQSPAARQIYEQADAVLGYPISRVCFEGPESQLTRTLYAQAGILATSVAAMAALREKFPAFRPALTAGLSLGEFTALVAAEALSFEDALKLVQVRAEAMEDAARNHPGTMASVMGLDLESCRAVAREAGCDVANLNSPEQTVLSGTVASVEKACQIAEAKGAKRAMVLKVGGAFHSALMGEARARLEVALAETVIRTPRCVFIPNVTGLKVSDHEEIRTSLAKQLTGSVHWVQTMATCQQTGIATYVEIGPGKVLKGLARKCQPALEVVCFGAVADLKGVEMMYGPVTL